MEKNLNTFYCVDVLLLVYVFVKLKEKKWNYKKQLVYWHKNPYIHTYVNIQTLKILIIQLSMIHVLQYFIQILI